MQPLWYIVCYTSVLMCTMVFDVVLMCILFLNFGDIFLQYFQCVFTMVLSATQERKLAKAIKMMNEGIGYQIILEETGCEFGCGKGFVADCLQRETPHLAERGHRGA